MTRTVEVRGTGDHAYTRCPGCRTVFRVTAEQLAFRDGQVRCGKCRAVFDAGNHFVQAPHGVDDEKRAAIEAHQAAARVEEPEPQRVEDEKPHDAIDEQPQPVADEKPQSVADEKPQAVEELKPQAVEDSKPQAVEDAKPQAVEDKNRPLVEDGRPSAGEGETAQPGDAGKQVDEYETRAPAEDEAHADTQDGVVVALPVPRPVDRAGRYEWRPRKTLREQPKLLYGLSIVALTALIAAQALFEYRDALAAHVRWTRPVLDAACKVAACAVSPLRDASALSIEASDLQADPAHKGLLKLTATVRNRASYPIAYPYLELTLTDASDAVVARRAFAPSAYVTSAPPAAGIGANGELVVSMFLDASGTSQAGYRLYLFYP